jgi:hypothetical protein
VIDASGIPGDGSSRTVISPFSDDHRDRPTDLVKSMVIGTLFWQAATLLSSARRPDRRVLALGGDLGSMRRLDTQ